MSKKKSMKSATPSKSVQKDATAGTIMTAHGSQEHHTPEADLLMDMIMLDTMERCGAPKEWCGNRAKLDQGRMPYSVQYLADNLPAVQFVAQFYLEMIIHGGILAKDKSNQEKLDAWLEQKNVLGQTNGNVLREALLSSIIYGYSGLRKVYNTVVYVPPQNFRIWNLPAMANGNPVPGMKAPILYEINMKHNMGIEEKESQQKEFALEEGVKATLANLVTQEDFVEGADGSYYIDDQQNGMTVEQVYITRKNFCHLRHSDEGEYGVSPLSKDRLRTTLIVDYIKNVTDEVANDGTDYMMYLKARGIAGSSLTSMLSTESANLSIKAGADSKASKTASDLQMEMARRLAKKLKRTNKTRFGIVSEDWVDKIEKMEGTVQLNNYLSILNDAKGTIADIYGIPAMLAGSSGGGWSTGMSALIDFTLNRTIKPFQQRYAEQLTDIVDACADIKGPIKFAEIEWTDKEMQATIRKLESEAALNFAKAGVEPEKAKAETTKAKAALKSAENPPAPTTPAKSGTKKTTKSK